MSLAVFELVLFMSVPHDPPVDYYALYAIQKCAFHYNARARFVITTSSPGSQNERYNQVAVYQYQRRFHGDHDPVLAIVSCTPQIKGTLPPSPVARQQDRSSAKTKCQATMTASIQTRQMAPDDSAICCDAHQQYDHMTWEQRSPDLMTAAMATIKRLSSEHV